MNARQLSLRFCFLVLLGAIALETVLGSRTWPRLVPLTAALFVAGGAAAAASDTAAVAVVLSVAYVFPALVLLIHGGFDVAFWTLWAAPLAGAILVRSWGAGWHVVEPWRTPLVLWALVIAATLPIVVVREIDFVPALLTDYSVPNSAVGWSAPAAVAWVLNVGIVLLLGILFFNWMTIRFDESAEVMPGWLIAPVILGGVASMAVALYQMSTDMLFVNTTVFGASGRASGAMLDGNAFGLTAVLVGLIALAASNRWRLAALALPLSWVAAWGSGSRSALAAAVIGAAFSMRAIPWHALLRSKRRRAATIAAAAAILLAFAVAAPKLASSGPVRRLRTSVSIAGGLRPFAAELWYRNGYGFAASRMIADHPWFGVGVGSFHLLVSDYGSTGRRPLVPDNAQNWYRHQLAEFGLIGSLGWMAWVGAFGACVVFGRSCSPARAASDILRGALVLFGVLSLVGMPGQDITVATTFWVIAFCSIRMTSCYPRASPVRLSSRRGILIALVVLVAAVGTGRAARGGLRVPERALRGGWRYSYGFYAPETGAAGRVHRWTRRRAAIVLACPTSWLKVTVWVNHADVADHPVDARVRLDGRTVVDVELRTTDPAITVVEVPRGGRVLLETDVNRVVRPSDLGLQDTRDLGLLIRWEFLPSRVENRSGAD